MIQNKEWRKLRTLVLVLALFVLTLTSAEAKTERVTICHALGNGGYQQITVDDDGAYNGHLGAEHQDGRDIIPNAQNWDAEGQAIYNNGCNVPSTPTSTSTTEASATPTEEFTSTATEEVPTPTNTEVSSPTPFTTETPRDETPVGTTPSPTATDIVRTGGLPDTGTGTYNTTIPFGLLLLSLFSIGVAIGLKKRYN